MKNTANDCLMERKRRSSPACLVRWYRKGPEPQCPDQNEQGHGQRTDIHSVGHDHGGQNHDDIGQTAGKIEIGFGSRCPGMHKHQPLDQKRKRTADHRYRNAGINSTAITGRPGQTGTHSHPAQSSQRAQQIIIHSRSTVIRNRGDQYPTTTARSPPICRRRSLALPGAVRHTQWWKFDLVRLLMPFLMLALGVVLLLVGGDTTGTRRIRHRPALQTCPP